MKRTLPIPWIILVLVLVSSCGSSAEQVPTTTPLAWTPTPPPTSTPTPLPYGLSLTITDDAGAPIPGAAVVFPESGSGDPVQADSEGKYVWSDLPSPTGALNVSAQGYLPTQQAATLERGPNELTVSLKRDPFGILPSEACPAGQNNLYLEDFQDG